MDMVLATLVAGNEIGVLGVKALAESALASVLSLAIRDALLGPLIKWVVPKLGTHFGTPTP